MHTYQLTAVETDTPGYLSDILFGMSMCKQSVSVQSYKLKKRKLICSVCVCVCVPRCNVFAEMQQLKWQRSGVIPSFTVSGIDSVSPRLCSPFRIHTLLIAHARLYLAAPLDAGLAHLLEKPCFLASRNKMLKCLTVHWDWSFPWPPPLPLGLVSGWVKTQAEEVPTSTDLIQRLNIAGAGTGVCVCV